MFTRICAHETLIRSGDILIYLRNRIKLLKPRSSSSKHDHLEQQ
jgi:hypothetical protein